MHQSFVNASEAIFSSKNLVFGSKTLKAVQNSIHPDLIGDCSAQLPDYVRIPKNPVTIQQPDLARGVVSPFISLNTNPIRPIHPNFDSQSLKPSCFKLSLENCKRLLLKFLKIIHLFILINKDINFSIETQTFL